MTTNKGQKMIVKFIGSIGFILIGAMLEIASIHSGNIVSALVMGIVTVLAVGAVWFTE
jgi:NhaP-type Na+/H+ or K+/H+ antiporter